MIECDYVSLFSVYLVADFFAVCSAARRSARIGDESRCAVAVQLSVLHSI